MDEIKSIYSVGDEVKLRGKKEHKELPKDTAFKVKQTISAGGKGRIAGTKPVVRVEHNGCLYMLYDNQVERA